MEAITIEFCAAEGDPFDRTLGFLLKSDRTLLAVRSIRLRPDVRIGEALTWVDRVVLSWATPQIRELEHIHDTLDELERALGMGEPFPL